jgi:hypothetical protein
LPADVKLPVGKEKVRRSLFVWVICVDG